MPLENEAKQEENTLLTEWVKKISQQDMPIFDRTAREAAGVAGNQSSSAVQLARVVLNDPAFTARVLRMANSALYNHGNHTINTVSRAVVMLGFEAIKSICITVAALDSLTANSHQSNRYKDKVLKEIARSFHAAVQARKLAESQNLRCVEEVFIAALLYHLGEMAFWCFAEDIGQDLEQAMARKGVVSSRAEKSILGFSFNELTQELCDEWKLGELLKSSLTQAKHKTKDGRIAHVLLGHDIAQWVEKGWSEPGVTEHLAKVAKNLNMDYAVFKELVYSGAKEARDVIKNYGAEIVSQYIPLPKELSNQETIPTSAHKSGAEEPQKQPKYYETNAQLQLKIMREVSDLMERKFDINLVLETILEGVYRAVGLDRVMFSLLNPRRTELKPKHAFGWQAVDKHKFAFAVTLQGHGQDPAQDWLSGSLLKKTPLWVRDVKEPKYAKGMTKALESLCGGSPFFLFPVVAKNEAIGLFYADRHASGRELNQELYESFEHFCRQANLAFVLATQK